MICRGLLSSRSPISSGGYRGSFVVTWGLCWELIVSRGLASQATRGDLDPGH